MTMKKIISVLAMALLVIGAAQAQEQVRKMTVHMNNGTVAKYNASDIQEVTFEMGDNIPDVPTTAEETLAMLLSTCWKMDIPLDDPFYDNFESSYLVIGGDPSYAYCVVKVKDSPADGEYSGFAGKYRIAYGLGVPIIMATSVFTFSGGAGQIFVGVNLHRDNFDLIRFAEGPVTYHCVLVDLPFDVSDIVWNP